MVRGGEQESDLESRYPATFGVVERLIGIPLIIHLQDSELLALVADRNHHRSLLLREQRHLAHFDSRPLQRVGERGHLFTT